MSNQLLCEAIAKRARVSFTHKGERYTVEPYSTGYPFANERRPGALVLRARFSNAWWDFEVKFMSCLALEADSFEPDPVGLNLQPLGHVLCDVLGKRWPA